MSEFRDLDEFFDPTLRLPIRGKTYVIPSPPADIGLFVVRLLTLAARARAGEELPPEAVATLTLDDDDERSLYERLLGPVLPEMLADGVSWEMVKHVGTTVFHWVGSGRETAEKFWATPPGEAPAPNRETRRASKGSGTSTRTAASTAGTTSRARKPKPRQARPGRT